MPMNQIQFQRGMPLREFYAMYGTEQQCEDALEKTRWPSGFRCPIMMRTCRVHASVHQGHQQLRHMSMPATIRLRCGWATIFESSNSLPLTTWFLAIYLSDAVEEQYCRAGAQAHARGFVQNVRELVKHKLMQVMAEREADRVSERAGGAWMTAYLAGLSKRQADYVAAAGKVPMVIAVLQPTIDEETSRYRYPCLHPSRSPAWFSRKRCWWSGRKRRWNRRHGLVSDGLACFVSAGELVNHHATSRGRHASRARKHGLFSLGQHTTRLT